MGFLSTSRDPQALLPNGVDKATVLDSSPTSRTIVACCICFYVIAVATAFLTLGDSTEHLLPAEQYAAQCAGTVLAASVVLRTIHLHFQRGSKTTTADIAMLATNAIAASSNLLMGTIPTPIIVDKVTGTSEYMIRWCEWTTLAFLMTFIVEGLTATSLGEALSLALLMGVSAGCGLVFPFCEGVWAWGFVMTVSFVTYFALFPRYARRRRLYHEAVASCMSASDVSRVVATKVSYYLMTCCTVMWTLITLDYCVTWAAALYQGAGYGRGQTRPQWPFILDCVLDVTAKLLYAHIISTGHAHVPREAERQQARWIREAMDMVWSGSQDTIVLSELQGEGTARSLASTGLAKLIGEENAQKWSSWRTQSVVVQANPTVARRRSRSSSLKLSSAELAPRTPSIDGSSSGDDSSNSSSSNSSSPWRERRQIRDMKVHGQLSFMHAAVHPLVHSLNLVASSPSDSGRATASNPTDACASFENLISEAWASSSRAEGQTCSLTWCAHFDDGSAGGQEKHCEIQVTQCERELHVEMPRGSPPMRERFLILVIRDVTERTRTADLEKQLMNEIADKTVLAERIGRKKDEEANRFSRHEVKNCVLAAMAQCEALVEWHTKTAESFAAGVDTQPLRAGLEDLSSKLQRTLNTVLAAAMAKDLANGEYSPKPEFTKVETLLRDNLASCGRFQLSLSPRALPSVLLDPQLLFCVHRNAISNAVKYGCATSPIETVVEVKAGTLTLRVVNMPGPNHDKLLGAQGAGERVFERGLRLHDVDEEQEARALHTERVSAGDGGWIMRRCALALGGECTIAFEPDKTVFELSCPVRTREEYDATKATVGFELPPSTVCIGIDDSKVQRTILKKIFSAVGAKPEQTSIYGECDEHIVNLPALLVQAVRAHPSQRVFVIGDENLDLTEGCACTTVSCTQAFAQLGELLSEEERARVLLVIPSANDSKADVDCYLEHAHGVLPKRGFAKQATIDAIAPMWHTRFAPSTPSGHSRLQSPKGALTRPATMRASTASGGGITNEIRCEVSSTVSKLIRELSSRSAPWSQVRRSLITIKGELASLNAVCCTDEERLTDAMRCIQGLLEHEDEPPAFRTQWPTLLGAINRALAV